jgi:MFS transporter, DHA2 family, methylenomycin A resistance protein
LFRSGAFVAACLSAGLFSAAVFGSQPFTSMFMQNYWDFSPLQGGLAFIPATALVALLMPVSGILAQRMGTRMRLIVMLGSLSVLVSFVYLLFLTVDSGYADGLLPAFLLRGLGIGLVMSAVSYAAVTTVPLAKSGLASGTLTMARQVGTSIGVAMFGAVFVHSIHTELPTALEGMPASEIAIVNERAEHFIPTGSGPAREAVDQVILNGFIDLAVAGILVAGIALFFAFFIRMLPPERPPVTAASQAVASAAVSREGSQT